MANQEHLDKLKQGIEIWNAWKWHAEGYSYTENGIRLSDLKDPHIDLQRANLCNTYLSHADLSGVNLRNANLSHANLSNADLRSAGLERVDLSNADLSNANLRGANLSNANLSHANLSNANLRYIQLEDTNLYEANFSNTDLLSTDLSNVDFRNTINLGSADLYSANLKGANLSDLDLEKIDLRDTNLNDANLSGANLLHADLSRAKLNNANLSGAHLVETVFADLDLRQTKGLLDIIHDGPSLVELYTVQLPQDGTALHFLRGTGVPDEWIDFWRSTMMRPVQYHSLFISYSSKDEILARRLHADFQAKGVRCWFAPEDLKIGDKIHSRIDEAIHQHEKLLLLLSTDAIISTWVEAEVEAALEKERRQQREVLFPVRLDESVMQTTQAWAANLRRTRHIGDFTNWTDPQAYQQSFERLLCDLKAEVVQDGKGTQ